MSLIRNMVRNKHISVVVWIVLGIAAGTIVGVPSLTDFLKYGRYDKKDFIDAGAYQAVFLTNDQIYFGHLKNISSDYLILSDVYYVKVNEEGVGQLVKLVEERSIVCHLVSFSSKFTIASFLSVRMA